MNTPVVSLELHGLAQISKIALQRDDIIARHPFSREQLAELIEASGLFAGEEPRGEAAHESRMEALQILHTCMFNARAHLRNSLHDLRWPREPMKDADGEGVPS